jgi:iron complex outermembrane receptor protein
LVIAGGGNVDPGFGTTPYGGDVGKETHYRVYAKYLNQDHLPNSAVRDGGGGWHILRGGFRTDSVLSSKDTQTFQGDLCSAPQGTPTTFFPSVTSSPQNIELLVNLTGGFIQGAWNHTLSPRSDTSLQVSYDTYERNDNLREGRGPLDIDFQNHFSGWARQSIAWGLTYRYSASHSEGNLTASLIPADLATQLFGSFVQDEIAIVPDRLYLTVGTKLEHNDYTGFDFMPSGRAAWAPSPHHTLWAAASTADRTPIALDASIRASVSEFPAPGGIPIVIRLIGNRRVVIDAMAREHSRQLRQGGNFGVVLIDFNHFKSINDTRGNLAGDSVLKEVSRRMASCVRPYDTVGRYGGEEFVVVVPSCDRSGAAVVTERILKSLRSAPVETGGGPFSSRQVAGLPSAVPPSRSMHRRFSIWLTKPSIARRNAGAIARNS